MMSGKMYRFRLPDDHIDSRFVEAYLQTTPAWDEIDRMKTGGSDSGLNLTHDRFRTLGVPVAPLNEQRRIVEAYEELVSDLDAGVAALERVREKLKLYRASILKAAVEGALTTEWRAQHPHTEPATELLKRILAERRRRWEEDQLARFKVKGQEPPKNWKVKYKEPVAPDTTSLPPLPEGWCWVTLDQLIWQVRSGTGESSGRDTTNFPVLKSNAVRHGKIDFKELNYLQQSQSLRTENFLQQGDFLITRLSGSVNYVGCSAVVKEVACGAIQYPDRIFCGKLVPSADATYLTYCFQHSLVRKKLEEAAKSTAGHQRISLSDLYPLLLALPPVDEQETIVEAVEDQLSVVDHLEADIDAKLKNARALRQSILRHAFTGQLVPQDPNDEPASGLLKRIAAERVTCARELAAEKRETKPPNGPKTGRRGRPKKTAKGND
jgi:type I restriction enzyme S subunit